MRSLLLLAAATASAATLALADAAESDGNLWNRQLERRDQAFVCDIPTNGCTNGMFNQAACKCECIEPYCPDWYGDCTNPSNSCGGNPWVNCVRGVNCPWWKNPLKEEACTTGPKVPLEEWNIYNTREACCSRNFPYSDVCYADADDGPPTKHPTIESPEEDKFEVIPIKFDVMGLPDNLSMRELKDEMTIVLKRILLRLADRIQGLKVSSVEERVVVQRDLLQRRLREQQRRGLEKDVTLYFNVYVVRDENKKFGPLIIQAIRDSYSEVMEQVQTFADTKFFGGDLNLNWCTSQDGKYEDCVKNITPPTPVRAPTPVVFSDTGSGDDSGGGLAGWAVALIVIFVLIVVCCAGYWIAVFCFGVTNCFAPDHYDENKEIHNNIYMDDGYGDRGFDDGRSRRSGRSKRTAANDDDVQIVLAKPEDPSFDDDSFTINTYGTKKSRKPGKDPTMYIPGQEDKPDPDNATTAGSSRRYYGEDPPLKPKRDPTMYVDGGYDPSAEDPPLKPKRDPTMFVEGQQDPTMYVDGASVDYSVGRDSRARGDGSAYGDADPYGMGGIDEDEEYDDQYGYKGSDMEGEYMTSEENAEYVRGRKDPSYYADGGGPSFHTQEPQSVQGSKRSKKSKKSKKKSSR